MGGTNPFPWLWVYNSSASAEGPAPTRLLGEKRGEGWGSRGSFFFFFFSNALYCKQ